MLGRLAAGHREGEPERDGGGKEREETKAGHGAS
jgi:hypothetical protein